MSLADDHGMEPVWILKGSHEGTRYRFRLEQGGNTVGSRVENHICLAIAGISKFHAVVRLSGNEVVVEDLASKNGTFLDGRRIQVAKVEIGATLKFARLSLKLERGVDEERLLAIRFESPDGPRRQSLCQETPRLNEYEAASITEREGPAGLVFPPSWLPGRSPAMSSFLAQLRSLVDSSLPVLILGETGSGKEGVARTLHLSSPRAGEKFVAINCAAIPEELLEAELFGIGSGVATGVGARPGRFVEARGGTLFLDEIGDMPEALQAKLLRVLQEGEIQPLGLAPRPLEVRVLAATHGDLAAQMVAGRFRRDLFYRLAGAAIQLPPLRQRQEDIPDLVAHFLSQAIQQGGRDIRGLTVAAMRLAVDHPWPGNVRQLQHAVERWVHQCPEHQVIDSEQVTLDLASMIDEPTAESSDDPRTATETAPPSASGVDPAELTSLNLASFEKMLIREALRRTDGNLTQAAEQLGLSRQALRRRIARHDLPRTEGG